MSNSATVSTTNMHRIVSNNSNFKVPIVRIGRKRYPTRDGGDKNYRFPVLFRAQEKNVFGAWQDISPLFNQKEMEAWVKDSGFESEHLFATGAEGLQFFSMKKAEVKQSVPSPKQRSWESWEARESERIFDEFFRGIL